MNFRLSKKSLKYAITIFIAAVGIWAAFIRSNSRFNGVLFKISAPLVRAGNSIYSAGRSILLIGQINRENVKLSRENVELSVKVSMLDEVEKENIALRKILGLPVLKDKKVLRADVAGFDPFNPADFLIVNKGKSDGVLKNMPVISEEGALVGKIESASDNSSAVLLIFSSRSSVAAISQNSRSSGVVKGTFGTSLSLDMVPQFDSIREDEILITSGIGGIFPKGIVIGKIESIEASGNEVFKKAGVKAFIESRKLENVIIILN